MDNQKMLHMVNEIARFYEPYTREEATAGISTHVTKYWERRFKGQLLDYVRAGGAGLHPLALEALQGLAATDTTASRVAPPSASAGG